jgi:hypothetical protein
LKYHYLVYLPALAIILALAWLLSGCANTPAQKAIWEDVGEVSTGVFFGAVLLAPDQTMRTETRTCTTDFWGNQNCTATVERH